MPTTLHEPLHDVGPLTLRLAALWAEASRTTREAKREELALVRQLAELHAAHRQLAEQGLVMPHSPDAERRRRAHVELLQSGAREVELELEAQRAVFARLRALAARQLSSARAEPGTSGPTCAARLSCFPLDPAGALLRGVFAGVVAFVALVFVLPLAAFVVAGVQNLVDHSYSDAVIEGSVAVAGVAAVVFGTQTVRLEFDGRWLRMSTRLLGMSVGTSRVVDLLRRKAGVTTHEEEVPDGGEGSGTTLFAAVVLFEEGGTIEEPVEVLFAARRELDEAGWVAQCVGAWCAVAKRPVA